ncbi:MAG: ribosome silencing factor [Pseudomonadota bacterium]|jgi:ribosome-associated protein
MTDTTTSASKNIQKLQRAIVDGLEDVKAQDIQVFDTEHITSLFERVIIASGTSNRQTKALAASVRDAVREAGFGKPRIEGEENGEWIIVDCGSAVAHIMQPTIRQYYHLEELWGDKPVKLKLGAVAPQAKASRAAALAAAEAEVAQAPGGRTAARTIARNAARKAGRASGEPAPASAKTAKPAARKAPAKSAAADVKAPAAKRAPAKTAAKTSKVAAKPAAKAPAKTAAPKTLAAKTAALKKPAAKKAAPKKVAAKKTTRSA